MYIDILPNELILQILDIMDTDFTSFAKITLVSRRFHQLATAHYQRKFRTPYEEIKMMATASKYQTGHSLSADLLRTKPLEPPAEALTKQALDSPIKANMVLYFQEFNEGIVGHPCHETIKDGDLLRLCIGLMYESAAKFIFEKPSLLAISNPYYLATMAIKYQSIALIFLPTMTNYQKFSSEKQRRTTILDCIAQAHNLFHYPLEEKDQMDMKKLIETLFLREILHESTGDFWDLFHTYHFTFDKHHVNEFLGRWEHIRSLEYLREEYQTSLQYLPPQNAMHEDLTSTFKDYLDFYTKKSRDSHKNLDEYQNILLKALSPPCRTIRNA
jgi:hypothetical protein